MAEVVAGFFSLSTVQMAASARFHVALDLGHRTVASSRLSPRIHYARGAWVPHLVLAESTWVLTSVYERGPGEIATAVEMLLNHEHLALQDSDAVAAAVERFRRRPALGFSDCLVLVVARKAGHMPLGTFDRKLAKLDGVERL
jgi:predicted nucleic-acid-binding protein